MAEHFEPVAFVFSTLLPKFESATGLPDLAPAPMSAPASPSDSETRRFHPETGAPSADRPTSSLPPSADDSLAIDGDSKLGAKKHTDDEPSEEQATCIQTAQRDLPAGSTLNAENVDAGKVDEETVAISIQPAPGSTSATHTPGPSAYTDGLEQPPEKASAEDPIAKLTALLEQQRLLNDSFRSEQKLWNTFLAERVGQLEHAGKAVAADEVIDKFPPDARETTIDLLQTDANADPDSTVGVADTAEPDDKSELAPSMWDGVLFLFRRDIEMGRVVTLWAVLVLLLNILLQTTIAVIVLLNMGDPTFVANIIADLWCASAPRFAAA